MGSCVSIHKSSESAMKFGVSFGSKNDKLEIPPSPVKEKISGGEIRIKDVALTAWTPSPTTKTFGKYGSKEEAFFDSRAWLDSDCEDDFFSVNGDFTPSRGNTPVNQGIARLNKTPFEARLPSNGITPTTPSPTEKKKRLLELFKESIRDNEEQAVNLSSSATPTNVNANANGTLEAKRSARGTPYLSGANSVCSSERTPNAELANYENEKPMKYSQCCLPSLISCRSFNERKKKMSPAIGVNDRA